MKYFLSLFDIFSYSIGFATLIFAALVYRKFRDKVNRDYLCFLVGFFIANLSYIGDNLSVIYRSPDYFSQHNYFAYIFEIIYCIGALPAAYYVISFIYRASGGQLPVMARVGLSGSSFIFLITDMGTVTYNNDINPNILISLARLYTSWFFIVLVLIFLAVIFRRFSRIQNTETKQQVNILIIACIIAIPAELVSKSGQVFLEQYQIPRYFFSTSLFYLIWSLMNIRFCIRRLMTSYHPKTIEVGDIFYQTHSISKREQEIIHLVIQGLSNQDIAAKLNITLATVKTHMHRVFFKTGVRSRMELLHKLNSPENGLDGKEVQ